MSGRIFRRRGWAWADGREALIVPSELVAIGALVDAHRLVNAGIVEASIRFNLVRTGAELVLLGLRGSGTDAKHGDAR